MRVFLISLKKYFDKKSNKKYNLQSIRGFKMKNIKIITILLPLKLGREIQEQAIKEHKTMSSLLQKVFRHYKKHSQGALSRQR